MVSDFDLVVDKIRQAKIALLVFGTLAFLVGFYLGLSLTYTFVLVAAAETVVIWPPARLLLQAAIFLLIASPFAYIFNQPDNAKKLMGAALLILIGAVAIAMSEIKHDSDS